MDQGTEKSELPAVDDVPTTEQPVVEIVPTENCVASEEGDEHFVEHDESAAQEEVQKPSESLAEVVAEQGNAEEEAQAEVFFYISCMLYLFKGCLNVFFCRVSPLRRNSTPADLLRSSPASTLIQHCPMSRKQPRLWLPMAMPRSSMITKCLQRDLCLDQPPLPLALPSSFLLTRPNCIIRSHRQCAPPSDALILFETVMILR